VSFGKIDTASTVWGDMVFVKDMALFICDSFELFFGVREQHVGGEGWCDISHTFSHPS
jgi:hypothetical protein